MASWIIHYMRNNIISKVLPFYSSHLTQPLDVEVFGPLKIHMALAIESIINLEIHYSQNRNFGRLSLQTDF